MKLRLLQKKVKVFLKKFRASFFRLLDSVIYLRKTSNHCCNIAIIRLDNIGDSILFIPYLQQILNKYQEQKIVLYVNEKVEDLYLNISPDIKVERLCVKKFIRNPIYRLKKIYSFSDMRANKVICPVKKIRAGFEDSIIKSLKPQEVYLMSSDNLPSFQSEIKLNIIDIHEFSHESLAYNKLLEILNFDGDYLVPDFQFFENFANCSSIKREDFICISIGAGRHSRKWPESSFEELINLVISRLDKDIVLIGDSSDIDGAENLMKKAVDNKRVLNLCNQTSLRDLFSIISAAKALVANESMAAHLASHLKTPTVCIIGGGHYGRFAPYPRLHAMSKYMNTISDEMNCYFCNWNCLYHNSIIQETFPCIQTIKVSKVFSELKKII